MAWSSGSSVPRPSGPWRTVAVVDDRPSGTVADRMPSEHLERVEVDVHGVRVAGQVDQLPDLVLPEDREEGRGVLEVAGDRAIARDLRRRRWGHDVTRLVGRRRRSTSSRIVSMLASPSSSRSTRATARRTAPASCPTLGRREVACQLSWGRPAGPGAGHAEAHHVGVRQEPVEAGRARRRRRRGRRRRRTGRWRCSAASAPCRAPGRRSPRAGRRARLRRARVLATAPDAALEAARGRCRSARSDPGLAGRRASAPAGRFGRLTR